MAGDIQVSLGGAPFVVGGNPAIECCCPGTTTTSVNPCTGGKVPLKVTISWTGTPPELTGGTYTWLGHDFSNGQTILVCPNVYNCSTIAPNTSTIYTFFGGGGSCSSVKLYQYAKYSNTWSITDANFGARYFLSQYLRYLGTHTNSVTCNTTFALSVNGDILLKVVDLLPLGGRSLSARRRKIGSGATYTIDNTAGLTSDDITPSTFSIFAPPVFIDDQMMGQLTTTSGVTIVWTRGVPSEWCGA